jgi:hypothetical protein
MGCGARPRGGGNVEQQHATIDTPAQGSPASVPHRHDGTAADSLGMRAESRSAVCSRQSVPTIEQQWATGSSCKAPIYSGDMPIVILRTAGLYSAQVTPPHGGGAPWSSPAPMSRDELVAALRAIGCHQTDIGDAFFGADPEWLSR